MDLEKKVNKNEKRIETVEQAIQLLSQLTINHTDEIERMLFGIAELRGSQKETQEKLDALIDAQIRGEDSMQELKKEMKNLAKLVGLAHQRIDKIEQN